MGLYYSCTRKACPWNISILRQMKIAHYFKISIQTHTHTCHHMHAVPFNRNYLSFLEKATLQKNVSSPILLKIRCDITQGKLLNSGYLSWRYSACLNITDTFDLLHNLHKKQKIHKIVIF